MTGKQPRGAAFPHPLILLPRAGSREIRRKDAPQTPIPRNADGHGEDGNQWKT